MKRLLYNSTDVLCKVWRKCVLHNERDLLWKGRRRVGRTTAEFPSFHKRIMQTFWEVILIISISAVEWDLHWKSTERKRHTFLLPSESEQGPRFDQTPGLSSLLMDSCISAGFKTVLWRCSLLSFHAAAGPSDASTAQGFIKLVCSPLGPGGPLDN